MEPKVVFNSSKNEFFKLSENFKTLHRKIKSFAKVEINKSDITPDMLKNTKMFVLGGCQEKFTEIEFKYLNEFIENGGVLLVLSGEGGESEFNTNINFFLEEYGMSINNDAVVRPHYYKYFHPKEAFISGGIIYDAMVRDLRQTSDKTAASVLQFMEDKFKVGFVYPFGATLNIVHPANVLLTSGPVAYPFNRPLAGIYVNDVGGKILAIGSGHMFHDKYIVNDTNSALFDKFLDMLLDKTNLSEIGPHDADIYDYATVPDTVFLAEQPKICLVESIDCDIPTDFKRLYDTSLHSINNNLLRDVIGAYEKLDVKYEPLKIIKPQFEIPLSNLQIAVFQPVFSDIPPPPLELFDLDEAFSSCKVQISQLAFKCLSVAMGDKMSDAAHVVNEKELEYFVQECGSLLGVSKVEQKLSAKEVIHFIGVRIANYKQLDKD